MRITSKVFLHYIHVAEVLGMIVTRHTRCHCNKLHDARRSMI